MSKRNLILLIIILITVVTVAFFFFYFYQPQNGAGTATEGTNFFTNFLPFGKSNNQETPTTTSSPANISGASQTNPNLNNVPLVKISDSPVAGYTVYNKERYKDMGTEFAPALRYAEKETGNVYESFADNINVQKFSKTIIPKIWDAYFGNNGNSVTMRYLKEGGRIETFTGVLPEEPLGMAPSGINEITGSFLPENVTNISISPDSSKMFYLFNAGEDAIGTTFSLNTGVKVQIFDSPFTEWLSEWPNDRMITITTKPASNVSGFMYSINLADKSLKKILGGINGLTTLTSPDGKMVLYGNDNLSLFVLNINTGESIPLGIKTLPEKCVWSGDGSALYCAVPKFIPSGKYPDSWYQGVISFSDELWKASASSGNTIKIADPAGNGEMDAIKLQLDEKENYLFFINKKDSSLWELRLK